MAKIKVTAEIEFDENIWYNEKYNDEYIMGLPNELKQK